MRSLVAAALLLVLAPSARAQADDDPKAARGDTRAAPTEQPLDDDDPKLARGAVHKRFDWTIRHDVPRFKLAYRYLVAAGLEGGDETFHAAVIDFYPSSGYLRFGLGMELGFAGGKYDAWYWAIGGALGLQWPARVTPFVEGRFNAGLLGGTAAGATAISWIYTGGIDTGIEVYYARRFYVTAAIGWAHPVYSGVDVGWVKAHPGLSPARKDFETDSFTFKVGLGL
jgi:hypothetical protein